MAAIEDTDDEENYQENYEENYEDFEAAPSPESGSSSNSISDEQDEQYDREQQVEQDRQDEQDEQRIPQAAAFKIPSRTISAVEHPFLIMDLDKGLETFGPNPQFPSVRPRAILFDPDVPIMLM